MYPGVGISGKICIKIVRDMKFQKNLSAFKSSGFVLSNAQKIYKFFNIVQKLYYFIKELY